MKPYLALVNVLFFLGCVTVLGPGCDTQSQAASNLEKKARSIETKSVKPKTSGTEKKSGGVRSQVAKVIFVGQKDACHCTKDRIKASWDALQAALTGTKGIQVERFDVDVDEARADKLDKLGRIMVIPGIYLMDAQGKLVKFFQGKVSQTQIAKQLF